MLIKDKIILQPLEITDYPFLVKWSNQKGMILQSKNKRKTNGYEQKTYISEVASRKDYLAFTILLQGEGKPSHIGVCELYNIDQYSRTCYINLYLEDKPNILAVYGFNILQLVLQHIFKRMGLYKVSVDLLLEQNIELTLFKQLDFKIEVRKREHAFVSGEYKTVVELSLLKPQFERKNG